MIITIDGPTSSGKSSVSKIVAEQLGFCHFSTGLLYRAVAFLIKNGFEGSLPPDLSNGLSDVDFSFASRVSARVNNKSMHIFFDNIDITNFLSDDSLSQLASKVSSNHVVRKLLLGVQRNVGSNFDIVVDGRDCGSVVFKDAKFKFFLTASIEVRAQRMMKDPKRSGMYQNFDMACSEIIKRDERDKNRSIAPLIVPDGAFIIDNSMLNLEQTAQKIIDQITRERNHKRSLPR